jgi:hypothetical protein
MGKLKSDTKDELLLICGRCGHIYEYQDEATETRQVCPHCNFVNCGCSNCQTTKWKEDCLKLAKLVDEYFATAQEYNNEYKNLPAREERIKALIVVRNLLVGLVGEILQMEIRNKS